MGRIARQGPGVGASTEKAPVQAANARQAQGASVRARARVRQAQGVSVGVQAIETSPGSVCKGAEGRIDQTMSSTTARLGAWYRGGRSHV